MKVSVLIATRGRPQSLKRAIQSVRRQTYPDIETIVVDDNGAESPLQLKTQEVVREFSEVRYLVNPANAGKPASLNRGALGAAGDVFAFLDDDDEFHTDKISRQIARLEETNAPGAYCNYERFFRNKLYVRSKLKRGRDEGDLALDMLLMRNEICGGSTLAIRRQAFYEAGGFDERFRRHVDWTFLIAYFRKHTLCLCEDHLATIHMGDDMWKVSPEMLFETKLLFFSVFKQDIARHGKAAYDIYCSHWMDVYFYALRARKFGLAAKCLSLSVQEGRINVPRLVWRTASAVKNMM